MKRLALIFTALVVVTTAALFVFGCGGGDEAQVDPNAVLSASALKMEAIKGFHFVYEVHKPGNAKPGPGLEIARITGDVNAEGSMRATIDVTQGNVPLTLNFIQIEESQYLQVGLWQKIPLERSPIGKVNLGAGTVGILQQVSGATYEGRESKGGAKCYHITGSVPAEAVKSIAGSTDTTTPFACDVWIGVDDGYVYEVDIKGAATSDELSGTSRSISVSKHDVLVDIKAPI